MNHFEYHDGALCCEGVPLEVIASTAGTPTYIYSTATLERHFDVLRDALAPRQPLIAYAVKANGNIAVLSTLARRGAGADTVSAGEIKRALAAGISPSRIVFSGVGKSEAELRFAISLGLHQINIESPAEFDLIETIARDMHVKPDLAIRVNPNVAGGGHDKISTGRSGDKFGISPSDARALFARGAASPHVAMRGLAVHVGSQIKDLAPLEQAFSFLRDFAIDLRKEGQSVERLDLGGGIGAPYFNEPDPPTPADYAAMVARVFHGFEGDLAFEPGRMIAANAGVLLSRIIRVQRRAERDILVLDAGMNDLMRPAMYEAYHDIKPVRQKSGALSTFDVVGPICETSDTFARNRALPALGPGDLVVLMTAGAYGASMSNTYNARDLIAEVLVKGDKFELIRRRFKVEDQIALEALPSWLR